MRRRDVVMRLCVALLAAGVGLGIVARPNPAWAAGTGVGRNAHAPRPYE